MRSRGKKGGCVAYWVERNSFVIRKCSSHYRIVCMGDITTTTTSTTTTTTTTTLTTTTSTTTTTESSGCRQVTLHLAPAAQMYFLTDLSLCNGESPALDYASCTVDENSYMYTDFSDPLNLHIYYCDTFPPGWRALMWVSYLDTSDGASFTWRDLDGSTDNFPAP